MTGGSICHLVFASNSSLRSLKLILPRHSPFLFMIEPSCSFLRASFIPIIQFSQFNPPRNRVSASLFRFSTRNNTKITCYNELKHRYYIVISICSTLVIEAKNDQKLSQQPITKLIDCKKCNEWSDNWLTEKVDIWNYRKVLHFRQRTLLTNSVTYKSELRCLLNSTCFQSEFAAGLLLEI